MKFILKDTYVLWPTSLYIHIYACEYVYNVHIVNVLSKSNITATFPIYK